MLQHNWNSYIDKIHQIYHFFQGCIADSDGVSDSVHALKYK